MPKRKNKKKRRQYHQDDNYERPIPVPLANENTDLKVDDDNSEIQNSVQLLQQENKNLKQRMGKFEKTIENLQNRNNSLTKLLNDKKEADLHQNKVMADNAKDKSEKEESKNDRCYIRDEVLEYNSIDKTNVKIRSEIKEKQETIDEQFDSHVARLTEWNDFSKRLENAFTNKGKLSHDEQKDDDEKKENNKPPDITQLLNSYKNCMKLLYKQQLRTEDITGYAKSLSTSKKELRKIVKDYTEKEKPSQQKYDELCASYKSLKERREQKQLQVMKLISEINDITKEENETNKEKCEMLDNLNISVVEKEKYDELLTKCKSLTMSYMKFQENVENKADELQKYYSEKWDDHEKLWPKWDVNDIVCWIKYLIHDKKVRLSNEVNLEEIAKEMNTQRVKGKQLEDIEKNDLKLFGFVIFDDMNQIWKRIRELVSKYPDVADNPVNINAVEGQVLVTRKIQIPQEYICPISGKIMVDPVQYEQVTYDKNNFLEHVKKCGTIPNTDQEYDESEPLFKNIRLKQKIDAFLVSNPQFVSEGV